MSRLQFKHFAPFQNHYPFQGGSSDASDEPITLKEYLQVKKQLVSAEAKVSQLLAMNKVLNQDVHMLQSMVSGLQVTIAVSASDHDNFH